MERKHVRVMFQGRLPRDDKGRKQTTEGNALGHIGKTLDPWPRLPSSIVTLCSNLALAVSCVGRFGMVSSIVYSCFSVEDCCWTVCVAHLTSAKTKLYHI